MSSPLFLLGATASGKHTSALELARRLDAEIVSIDSMKVYRLMDVGTAKPTPAELKEIPHHLIDILDSSDSYNAGRFVVDAQKAQEEIESRGKIALFVGGTALYYKAFMYGLFRGPEADHELRKELSAMGGGDLHAELSRVDPVAATRIHPNDMKRLVRAVEVYRKTGIPISEMQTQFDSPKIEATVLCIRWEREILRKRIESRVDQMLRSGQVEEVKHLLTLPWGKEGRQAVGYREIASHLAGEIDLQEARRQMIRNTAELARRQVQWFRSFPELSWVEGPDVDRMEEMIREGTSA